MIPPYDDTWYSAKSNKRKADSTEKPVKNSNSNKFIPNPWTEGEVRAVHSHFAKQISFGECPGKAEITEFLQEFKFKRTVYEECV